jgi:hypothetical protein
LLVENLVIRSEEPGTQGGALKPKFSQLKTQTKNSIDRAKVFCLRQTSLSSPPLPGAGRHRRRFSDALLVKVEIKKAERGRR